MNTVGTHSVNSKMSSPSVENECSLLPTLIIPHSFTRAIIISKAKRKHGWFFESLSVLLILLIIDSQSFIMGDFARKTVQTFFFLMQIFLVIMHYILSQTLRNNESLFKMKPYNIYLIHSILVPHLPNCRTPLLLSSSPIFFFLLRVPRSLFPLPPIIFCSRKWVR